MKYDIVILNADIRPMTGGSGRPDALAIAGNRIVRMGDSADIQAGCEADTQVIDADRATVLPGFVESHMHLFFGAHSASVLPLHGVRGTSALTDAILEFASEHPGNNLLVAHGVAYQAFDNDQDADRHVLDVICPERPVLLQSADFHNGWANTVALKSAGVFNGRDLGPGSRVEVDEEGTATGVLTEPPAVAAVQALGDHGGREVLGLEGVEPREEVTREQREADKALLRAGLRRCAENGITTIINMDGNVYQGELLREIEIEGDLICRLELPYHFIPGEPDDSIEVAEQMRRDLNSEMLWCNRVKFFMDGVLDMGTAFRVQDYPGQPGHKSRPLHDPARFAEVATELDRRGFQIAVHAIADGAVRTVLDGYEAAYKANGPQGNRHRVEHIELLDPADLPRFSELGVIASVMPPHPPGCGDFPLEPLVSIIGKDQWKDAYVWRTLQEAGARVCFSSDWPIAKLPPLEGIHIAVNREKWADHLKDERLSFDDTLAAYTVEGAFAARKEDQFGSLAEGKLADVVILDRTITHTNTADASVAATICNGVFTYRNQPCGRSRFSI